MSRDVPSALILRVITPKSLAVDAKVHSVTLPGAEGSLGILPGHRPLVVSLGRGWLTYKHDEEERKLSVEGGYAEVGPDAVLVFTRPGQGEESEDSQS